jgi:crossover junction endodeoxyribonuclease RusA
VSLLNITVHGIPAPQGSKKHVGNGVMVEMSKRLPSWREAVKTAAVEAKGDREPMTGPVELYVNFHFPRPKSHYGTGRNAATLKQSAPLFVAKAPDLSKLIRSIEDALTEAGVWRDDALVVMVRAEKYYNGHGFAGANITVREVE